MTNFLTPWMTRTLGAILTTALAYSAAPAFAAKEEPVKTPLKATKTIAIPLPSTKTSTKPTPKQPTKPTIAADAEPADKVSVDGAYESNGNLLTIKRYVHGKKDEYLISFFAKEAGAKTYCPFFGALTIPEGASQFEVSQYMSTELPITTTECNMRIKADEKQAHILEMSKGCQLLCGESRAIDNPGALKRVSD